ncbi:MAG: helix-turn-helix domain-containing protein [Lachnospiraceae bacterium]|nr:helix-turn-helix domain-containing protein [Lachnospiraceae bacterium]
MPETKQLYDVEDVQRILQVGRTTAYQFVREAYKNQKPFKVIKIGRVYRIPRQKFDEWVSGEF